MNTKGLVVKCHLQQPDVRSVMDMVEDLPVTAEYFGKGYEVGVLDISTNHAGAGFAIQPHGCDVKYYGLEHIDRRKYELVSQMNFKGEPSVGVRRKKDDLWLFLYLKNREKS